MYHLMYPRQKRHPDEKELALYSSGDLNFVDKMRVRWHLRSCADCDSELNAARALTVALRSHANALPAGVDWDRLSAEMTANIHLGLEAGECVGPAARAAIPDRIGWRAAAVMAGMTVVLFTAWWLNPPRGRETASRHAPVEMGTAPGGIELKRNGSALMLLHTRGQQSPIIVSTPGSLRARFVDQDTGQVTINNVYSD
jgi:hypothetical protein